jgi:hypothetical protein
MQVYDSVKERIFCLPAACAMAAGFLVYLGPFQFPFRRIMLTNNWIKCLNDRGLPLVLDQLNLIKGRVVKWQMDSLSYLLSNAHIIGIPGEDWKVHFASDQIDNQLFMGQTSASDLFLDKPLSEDSSNQESKTAKINAPNRTPELVVTSQSTVSKPKSSREEVALKECSEMMDPELTETIQENNEPNDQNKAANETIFIEESMLKIDGQNFSTMSRLSEQVRLFN